MMQLGVTRVSHLLSVFLLAAALSGPISADEPLQVESVSLQEGLTLLHVTYDSKGQMAGSTPTAEVETSGMVYYGTAISVPGAPGGPPPDTGDLAEIRSRIQLIFGTGDLKPASQLIEGRNGPPFGSMISWKLKALWSKSRGRAWWRSADMVSGPRADLNELLKDLGPGGKYPRQHLTPRLKIVAAELKPLMNGLPKTSALFSQGSGEKKVMAFVRGQVRAALSNIEKLQ